MASKKAKAGHRWIGCHFLVIVQLKSPAGIVFNPGVELECYGVDHGKLHLRNPRAPVRLIRGVHPWMVREVVEEPSTWPPDRSSLIRRRGRLRPWQVRFLAEQPPGELAEEIDKDLRYDGRT